MNYQPEFTDRELLMLSDLLRRARNGAGVYTMSGQPEFMSAQDKIEAAIVVRWRGPIERGEGDRPALP